MNGYGTNIMMLVRKLTFKNKRITESIECVLQRANNAVDHLSTRSLKNNLQSSVDLWFNSNSYPLTNWQVLFVKILIGWFIDCVDRRFMFLDYSGVINSANSLNTEIFDERRLLRKIRLCLSDRAQRLCLSDRQRY